jgi:hypothetical protein
MPSTGMYGHSGTPVSVSPVVEPSLPLESGLVVGDVVIDVVISVVIDVVGADVIVVVFDVPPLDDDASAPVSLLPSFGQPEIASDERKTGSQTRCMTPAR